MAPPTARRERVGLQSMVLLFFVLLFGLASSAIIISIYALLNSGVPGPAGKDGVDGTVPTFEAIMVEYYMNNTAQATTFVDATTWVKVLGTTHYAVSHDTFLHSNNRFTYVGTKNVLVHGYATFSFTTSSANEIVHTSAAKNGVPIAATIAAQKSGASGDVSSSSLQFICTLDTYDYVEMWSLSPTWSMGETSTYVNFNVGILVPPGRASQIQVP